MKNLIESIKAMYQPKVQNEATMMKDDGQIVHNCAQHVEHATWGQGRCIKEEHADPDRYGNIAWYDIEFPHGIEKGVPVTELKVLQAESHGHATKKAKKKMAEEAVDEGVVDMVKAGAKKVLDKVGGGSDEDQLKRLQKNMGVPQTGKKPVKEDSELDEASFSANAALERAKFDDKKKAQGYEKVAPFTYRKKPAEKTVKEDAEQIDEISDKTKENYLKAARADRANNKQDMASGDAGQVAAARERDKKRQAGMNKVKAQLNPGTVGYAKVQARRMAEDFEEQVDETVIHADREYDIQERNFSSFFKKKLAAHPKKSLGAMSDDEKKMFFKNVDNDYSAKNEDVFLEAYMSSDIQDVITAHKKAGNKISDEKSGSRDGKPHHSFVVTTPEGKRTRHIYHGTTKKLESMSPAKKSRESAEQDLDDK